jgi:hypothetical protein
LPTHEHEKNEIRPCVEKHLNGNLNEAASGREEQASAVLAAPFVQGLFLDRAGVTGAGCCAFQQNNQGFMLPIDRTHRTMTNQQRFAGTVKAVKVALLGSTNMSKLT